MLRKKVAALILSMVDGISEICEMGEASTKEKTVELIKEMMIRKANEITKDVK